MDAPVYLGDEVCACGFRLAGVDTRVPVPGAEAAALAEALERAPVVLVSATIAARIPAAVLQAALRRPAPVTVVVPDLRESAGFADVAGTLRRQLGIDA